MNLTEPQQAMTASVFADLQHCELLDLSGGPHPTTVSAWSESGLDLRVGATHFGFIYRGPARMRHASGEFTLSKDMYFAAPDACRIEGGGQGIVISRVGYQGFFQIGGPIEARGRLHYINGCTDSLLIPPVLKGDACLNLLHVPPRTDQTAHTHPSIRIGLVAVGEGYCETPRGASLLLPGTVFIIPAGELHSFHTTDSGLTIIDYDPDSDFGPTHEEHPMLNRTIIGDSAIAKTSL